uniref:Uncharacterized protein n=1 Tax=Arundo donax TaxID=35708 RepID=A0A0A9CJS8_ARUDO
MRRGVRRRRWITTWPWWSSAPSARRWLEATARRSWPDTPRLRARLWWLRQEQRIRARPSRRGRGGPGW